MKIKILKPLLLLGIIFGVTASYADILFYYSAAILPSIIHNKTGTPIGSIQSLAGSKTLVIESVYDKNSTDIYVGDVIVTDENTTASILLNNNTLIKLGVHTFLKITDYVFDDETAVSSNPNIVKPVPFNLVVEGTIEIIDNYIETVQDSTVEASALIAKSTLEVSNAKEKTVGTFETRTMTYEEYNIYNAIDENKDTIKSLLVQGDVYIAKILREKEDGEGDDDVIFSELYEWMSEKFPPSCSETPPRRDSLGVRGTDFIHYSGTCSEDPATFVKDGAIDIAENDIVLPLELEEGEVTRDLMDKETADREFLKDLYEELYRPEPYILNWNTDNCVIVDEDNAKCYYDNNHISTNVRQIEGLAYNANYYEIEFYNRENELVSRLKQHPSNMNYIDVSTTTEESSFGGYTTYYGGYSLSTSVGIAYYINKFDENNILRSRSYLRCQYTDYRKYDQYWDAEGNPILNTTQPYIGENTHNFESIYYENIYGDNTKCPTYKEVDAILNFDWSQSRLYQLELTGS